jgi:hypothetical protein
VAKRKHGAGPPVFWGRPDGGREPVREPSEAEVLDMLCRLRKLPKGRHLDEELYWQLVKLLQWLLYGKELLSPSAGQAQAGIDMFRAILFAKGIEAVGWIKAGDWAVEQVEAGGVALEIYGCSALTMRAAYKKMKRHLGRPLTYRPHPSRVAPPGPDRPARGAGARVLKAAD